MGLKRDARVLGLVALHQLYAWRERWTVRLTLEKCCFRAIRFRSRASRFLHPNSPALAAVPSGDF